MPNFDYLTTTPGSAVADTVQALLTQRREEARQAMLDKLNAENVHSDIEYRTGQLGLAKDRDKWDKEKDALGMIPGGTDPGSVDPMYAEMARRLGLIRQRPEQAGAEIVPPQAEEVSGEQAAPADGVFRSGVEQPFKPSTPAREEFVGDKDYQKQTRAQEDIDALGGQFKDEPDMLRALVLARNGVTNGIPADLAGPKPTFQPITPTGEKGKTITGERGTQFGQIPYPPSSYIPAFQPYFDPGRNQSVMISNRMGADGKPQVVDLPGDGRLERPAGPDQTPDTGIQTAINNYRVAAGSTGGNRDENMAAARSGIIAAASRSLLPQGQAALMAVTQRFAGGQRQPTAADIPQTMEWVKRNYPSVTPAEMQTIQVALTGLLSIPLQ